VVDAGEKQAAGQRRPIKGNGLAARCFAVLMSEHVYTVGVDFGTLSARAVVARCSDGHIMGSSEFTYPHAVMTQTLAASGEALPVDWALQDPNDYIAALRHAVPAAVSSAAVDASRIVAIGTDFTACTVLPVAEDGTPLCNLPEFSRRPHAYVKLWKHHAAQPQADRINECAR
jgi:L-ribulokinase